MAFNIYEQDNFVHSWVEHEKKFYNLWPESLCSVNKQDTLFVFYIFLVTIQENDKNVDM